MLHCTALALGCCVSEWASPRRCCCAAAVIATPAPPQATEDFIVHLFEDCNLCAIHAKRVTISACVLWSPHALLAAHPASSCLCILRPSLLRMLTHTTPRTTTTTTTMQCPRIFSLHAASGDQCMGVPLLEAAPAPACLHQWWVRRYRQYTASVVQLHMYRLLARQQAAG